MRRLRGWRDDLLLHCPAPADPATFSQASGEILIYGTSLAIVVPFLIAMIALHCVSPPNNQFWTHSALALTIIYAVFGTANYVVQLATVIPANLSGRGGEVALLQQSPHSLFWDFDAIAYISMGLAMLVAIPALHAPTQRAVRKAFLANALATPLICIVYFYPIYSEKLLLLGVVWAITAPVAMICLALNFRGGLERK